MAEKLSIDLQQAKTIHEALNFYRVSKLCKVYVSASVDAGTSGVMERYLSDSEARRVLTGRELDHYLEVCSLMGSLNLLITQAENDESRKRSLS